MRESPLKEIVDIASEWNDYRSWRKINYPDIYDEVDTEDEEHLREQLYAIWLELTD